MPYHKFTGTGIYDRKFKIFQEMMSKRVQNILMVSSPYDVFILEEEGNLSEKIFTEYMDLQLRNTPVLTRASTGEEALKLIEKRHFDLVVTMARLADIDVYDFGRKVKEISPGCPVVLLAYDKSELHRVDYDNLRESIDSIYVWTGDASIMLAIVKQIEDQWNVEYDTQNGNVRVIIVIEDSIRYYSLFLPTIYALMMTQARELIDESLNDMHKFLRMRARPKILLANSYEEGMELFHKYRDNVLGIISDIEYTIDGVLDEEAGFKLVNEIKEINVDIPVLLQSAKIQNREKAQTLKAQFLNKNSRNLINGLRKFIKQELGFGDFLFRKPTGEIIARASNMKELEAQLMTIPSESLLYHASRNHFSTWLRARTEFTLANDLSKGKTEDFEDVEDIRNYIVSALKAARYARQQGVIAEFSKSDRDFEADFLRLGRGALGGKARGLGFISLLLLKQGMENRYPGVRIKVPKTVVICTDEFDRFIENNEFYDMPISKMSDEQIARAFLKGKIPDDIKLDLEEFLIESNVPLAVRSSSLLEDSHYQPFAGIYSTYMLPNKNSDLSTRLRHLTNAIKLIYASTYMNKSTSFLEATQFNIQEEKMAVIIQELVGRQRDNLYYPMMSGVAQSFNYYPFSYQEPDDGIAHLALGLGRIVVEGGSSLRFSPKYPKILPQFGSAKAFVKNSQKKFFALQLNDENINLIEGEDATLLEVELNQAEKHNVLKHVASTYIAQDDVIRDSLFYDGPRVVTHAQALKYGWFPLPEILLEILEIGKYGMGTDVEIEFAADFSNEDNGIIDFNILQIRPLASITKSSHIDCEDVGTCEIFCKSVNALGNGIYSDIRDIVFVDPNTFDKSMTLEIASQIGMMNRKFKNGDRYVLIGPGRWGSSDHWLGIPVEWQHISNASLIVEAGIKELNTDPSYGSHFFQNITSLNVGYLTVMLNRHDSFVNWEWLNSLPLVEKTEFVKHVRLDYPIEARIDGRSRTAVLLKSLAEESE